METIELSNLKLVKVQDIIPKSNVINLTDSSHMLELLDRIKNKIVSGELDSLAIAGACKDGSVLTAWSHNKFGNNNLLIGAVEQLKYRLITKD